MARFDRYVETFPRYEKRRRAETFERNRELEECYHAESIVGISPAMQKLYLLLDKLRESDSTVLIQGENGTGKEMVARAVHSQSRRGIRPFVTQNCSAFNDNLLDSELFGHVRGSFTGAIRDKKGLVEVADGGIFFLDEIGDMSPALQVKLLRFLQEGTFLPVGGTAPRKVNVRVIAATNRDLRRMVDCGEFREDLYYRINVINIGVPPLRERREDIPFLVEHFLRKHTRTSNEKRKAISPEALDALVTYDWPGNVRQLENEIQRALVMVGSGEWIEKDVLSPVVLSIDVPVPLLKGGKKLRDAMDQVVRQLLVEGLRRHQGNKSRLARELGISRTTLLWKIEKYGLTFLSP